MKRVLALILIFLSFSCNSQDRKIEKIYNDCYFNSMPDNGKQVKEYYKTYEKLLISVGLLKDNSSESYYKLFKKVLTEKLADTVTNFSLIDTINKLNYSDIVLFNVKCTEKIKALKEYKNSNTYILEKRIDSIKDNLSPEKQSKIILKTYDQRDFEIEYFKIRALLILEMYKTLSELDIHKPSYSKERIENALEISLSKENNISVNNKLVSNVELKNIIRNYLLKNKALSLITINSNRDTKYSYYIEFIEKSKSVITELKNEISKDLFNKKYENLSEAEKAELDNKYSFEVIENTPE